MVDYGKTYLVRIVNAAMNAELFFAIANHSLTVVGMDGNYVKPIITDYLVISPGQTMDVLLTANQSSLSHYYVATRQYDSARPDVTNYDQTNATAILMYSGNYTAPDYPIFPSSLPSYEDFRAADRFLDRLRSLASKDHPVNVPLNVTTKMFITVSMNQILCPNESCDGIDGNRLSSSLNNISFVNPSTDILLAYYRYSHFPDHLFQFFIFNDQNPLRRARCLPQTLNSCKSAHSTRIGKAQVLPVSVMPLGLKPLLLELIPCSYLFRLLNLL